MVSDLPPVGQQARSAPDSAAGSRSRQQLIDDAWAEVRTAEYAIATAQQDLAVARGGFSRALAKLYAVTGMSYAELAPQFGLTRSRMQQLVEAGRS